jgi:dihydroorotate dehydrogenase electron transfer subunit
MAPSSHLAGRIVHVSEAGSRGVTIELDLRLEARPGQFVMVWLPGVDEKPFSLVDDDPATLTVVRVGPFTERMQRLRPGGQVYLRGPLGNGFSLAGERPLLVGGGCGAAPLAFLAKLLRGAGLPVTVALGAQTGRELLLEERFAGLGASLLVTTEDGSAGEQGLVTEAAVRRLAAGQHDQVYACGPEPMLARVVELCRTYSVPGELSWEAYMRCGIGVCGSCDRGDGLLVCRDGPVFSA